MEEETLVKRLALIGAVCLSIITISGFFTSSKLLGFSSSLVPLVLCEKGQNDTYVLSQPTSYELCSDMDDIKEFVDNPRICDGYGGDQRSACLELVEIAKDRYTDCIGLSLGKDQTTVDPMGVKTNCELLDMAVMS